MMTIEDAIERFVWPHQAISNFRQEGNGFVSFCIADHIKHDFWYVKTNGHGIYNISAQYDGG